MESATEELKNAVNAMQARLTEAEGRISDLEDSTQQLVNGRELHSKRIDALWSRVEDLENRSRRNNVRLLGLKEGIEGDNLNVCIEKILSEGLHMHIDNEFEIERAHRSPGFRPDENQPPRLIMIRFLRSTARDKVLKAARENGGAVWNGCNISLFPDMSKELAERRKTFTTAKQLLRDKNVRFRLAFPATLHFAWKGRNRKFDVATEAVKFI
uniref:L1 transposable element RRM domain-containing protein n=1 Tax=Pygocentrus nattereri TaxID=42514 RepID=A0AAR2JAN4_PYGNA